MGWKGPVNEIAVGVEPSRGGGSIHGCIGLDGDGGGTGCDMAGRWRHGGATWRGGGQEP